MHTLRPLYISIWVSLSDLIDILTIFKAIDILEKWQERCWNDHYRLLFDLYAAKAEASFLVGDYDIAESIYPFLLQKANSRVDKGIVYLVMYAQYEVQVFT